MAAVWRAHRAQTPRRTNEWRGADRGKRTCGDGAQRTCRRSVTSARMLVRMYASSIACPPPWPRLGIIGCTASPETGSARGGCGTGTGPGPEQAPRRPQPLVVSIIHDLGLGRGISRRSSQSHRGTTRALPPRPPTDRAWAPWTYGGTGFTTVYEALFIRMGGGLSVQSVPMPTFRGLFGSAKCPHAHIWGLWALKLTHPKKS